MLYCHHDMYFSLAIVTIILAFAGNSRGTTEIFGPHFTDNLSSEETSTYRINGSYLEELDESSNRMCYSELSSNGIDIVPSSRFDYLLQERLRFLGKKRVKDLKDPAVASLPNVNVISPKVYPLWLELSVPLRKKMLSAGDGDRDGKNKNFPMKPILSQLRERYDVRELFQGGSHGEVWRAIKSVYNHENHSDNYTKDKARNAEHVKEISFILKRMFLENVCLYHEF